LIWIVLNCDGVIVSLLIYINACYGDVDLRKKKNARFSPHSGVEDYFIFNIENAILMVNNDKNILCINKYIDSIFSTLGSSARFSPHLGVDVFIKLYCKFYDINGYSKYIFQM